MSYPLDYCRKVSCCAGLIIILHQNLYFQEWGKCVPFSAHVIVTPIFTVIPRREVKNLFEFKKLSVYGQFCRKKLQQNTNPIKSY